jgi:hypothetical protein
MHVVLSVILALLSPFFAAVTSASDGSPAASRTARMSVTLLPYQGVIPASLANGRPVYVCEVLVFDGARFLSAREILQPGMRRDVVGARDTRRISGWVSLDREGRARYEVTYATGREPQLSSAADLYVPQ